MRWFGPPWDAPLCDPSRHAPTPLGSVCVYCSVMITDQDQGVLVPRLERQPGRAPLRPVDGRRVVYHRRCLATELGMTEKPSRRL